MTFVAASAHFIVEADGGSRGNPGIAGYGALVRDARTRRVLAERAAPLGKESNNVAEYTGLIEGLRAAYSLNPSARVTVRMDSKLVVEQMAGRWKIKHEDMRRLALEAQEVCRQIVAAGGSVSFEWIPRAENKAADALSNKGMDGERIHRDVAGGDGDAGADADPGADAGAGAEASAGGPRPGGQRQADPVVERPRVGGPPPTMTGSSRILLVRHGITDFTASSRMDGRGGSNPSLNDIGRRQAAAAASAVREIVRAQRGREVTVVTSGLRRAQETGAAVAEALGVEPVVDADWDEVAFGDWDGRSFPELVAEHPDELRRLRFDPTYARPGGESTDELHARVAAAYGRAVDRGGVIVVASHRRPILAVLSEILHVPATASWAFAIAPASLTAVEVWPDGNASIAFTNRTHHLTGDLVTRI